MIAMALNCSAVVAANGYELVDSVFKDRLTFEQMSCTKERERDD